MDKKKYLRTQTLLSISDALLEISNKLSTEISFGMREDLESIEEPKHIPFLKHLNSLKVQITELRVAYESEVEKFAQEECLLTTELEKIIKKLSRQIKTFEIAIAQDLIHSSKVHKWRAFLDAPQWDKWQVPVPISIYIQFNFKDNLPPRFIKVPSVIAHEHLGQIDRKNPLIFGEWYNQPPLRNTDTNFKDAPTLCETLKLAFEHCLIDWEEMQHIESICYDSRIFKKAYLFMINNQE